MSRRRRLLLFSHAADGFFAGVDWLAAPTGVPALALQVAGALTRLIIDQAGARFEAVVDEPIGVLSSGYDVPGPDEIFDWFEFDPDPPELATQFAPEIAAGDWQALQRIHRVLHEVLVLKRPILREIFAKELAAKDYRAVVAGYDLAKAQVAQILGNPKTRGALREWWSLLSGDGPERDDAEAAARLREHWHGLHALVVEAVT